jgi:RNA polymerase sigma-70 factor (ECF subfamily)
MQMVNDVIRLLIQSQCDPKGSTSSLLMQLPLAGGLFFSLKNQDKKISHIGFSEQDDVQKSQNGDAEAFRRLVQRHQEHVSKLMWRFTRDKNSHQELVQESFVEAYLSLHSYKARAPFEHWLSRIATRVGYRYWKQLKRHPHVSLQDSDWKQITEKQPESISPEDAAGIVHQCLAKLPPRDRLVLTLRYLEQCDVKETARRTGWSLSLVKVQTCRAKQKLKKLLEKTNIEFEM